MISDTLKEGLKGKVVAVFDEVYQVGYLKVLADALSMAITPITRKTTLRRGVRGTG